MECVPTALATVSQMTGSYIYSRQRFEAALILGVKSPHDRAIEVKNTQDLPAANERHDQLGARGLITGDMTWESMNVFDQDGSARLNGGSAHAVPDRDADAGRLALEWPDDEFLLRSEEIEAGPVHERHHLEDQRRCIGRVGDRVVLAVQKRAQLDG